MRFYIDGCDADLSLGEFLLAWFLGTFVIAGPLLLKFILLTLFY